MRSLSTTGTRTTTDTKAEDAGNANLTEVEKEFCVSILKGLNEKLERIRTNFQDMDGVNDDMKDALEAIEQGRKDIAVYFQGRAVARNAAIGQIEEKLEEMKKARDQEARDVLATIDEYKTRISTSQAQITEKVQFLNKRLCIFNENRLWPDHATNVLRELEFQGNEEVQDEDTETTTQKDLNTKKLYTHEINNDEMLFKIKQKQFEDQQKLTNKMQTKMQTQKKFTSENQTERCRRRLMYENKYRKSVGAAKTGQSSN